MIGVVDIYIIFAVGMFYNIGKCLSREVPVESRIGVSSFVSETIIGGHGLTTNWSASKEISRLLRRAVAWCVGYNGPVII